MTAPLCRLSLKAPRGRYGVPLRINEYEDCLGFEMSAASVREQNIKIFTEKALECFLEKGIDNTSVSEIASRCGLTERSAFRYFETKADLVRAVSYLYWNRVIAHVERIASRLRPEDEILSGAEEIGHCLLAYANLYLEDPGGIRFTLDAEIVLNRAGKSGVIPGRPPEPLETSRGPVAKAIRKGLKDGSIDPGADVEMLYYNSYDAILGMMQRLSVGGTPSADKLDYGRRMRHLCDMFVRAFSGK